MREGFSLPGYNQSERVNSGTYKNYNQYERKRSTHNVMLSIVPDKRSRIHEVIVVRRLLTWVLGFWSGEGMGRVEEGEVSL
jgi:hypothetical protein